jgi:colicin import membrane protein
MHAIADELDLSPPPARGGWLPWTLAVLAHGVLALALTWGLAWQREAPTVVASAELWSTLPQTAAPRAQEPPPAPAEPTPAPPRPAPPPPAATDTRRDADIALQRQREQQRRADEARRQAEERRLAEERAARERREREQAEKVRAEREKAEREKAEREKAEREKVARERAQRAEREKAEQALLEAERQRNLERILGQAGASGGPSARGSAERDAGPSASYAGKLVAHIRPHIVFTDTVPGNPRAEVEVRTLPDGTILSARLLKSSGHRAWDDAVLRAIERTARLPRDENGRVPSTLILGFRPNE